MLTLDKRGKWYHVRGKNSEGTLIKRHSTQCATKEAASRYLRSIDDAKEWPRKEVKPQANLTFVEALERYLKFKRSKHKEVSRKLAQYDLIKYMIEPLAERQVTTVAQLHSDHCVDLQDGWLNRIANGTLKFNSLAVHRRNSSAFCKYLTDFGHLPANPWKKVGWPTSEHIGTLPLDEDDDHVNWKRIRESIVPFLATLKRPSNPLWRHPQSFLALLELMYETGLRRSDAVQFDPRQLEPTELGNFAYTTQQTKTDKPVTVFLEPWLAEKLTALPRLEPTGLPFYNGHCANLNIYIDWYVAEPLYNLGLTLGMTDERSLRCHRFRDSFAVNFLNAGGSLEDLKDLLGHQKLAITERYYNPWVKSRQKAVEKRLVRVRAQQNPATKLTVVPPAA